MKRLFLVLISSVVAVFSLASAREKCIDRNDRVKVCIGDNIHYKTIFGNNWGEVTAVFSNGMVNFSHNDFAGHWVDSTRDVNEVAPEVNCQGGVCRGDTVSFVHIFSHHTGKVISVYSDGMVYVEYNASSGHSVSIWRYSHELGS